MHLGELVMILPITKLENCRSRVWKARVRIFGLVVASKLERMIRKSSEAGCVFCGDNYLVESESKSKSWNKQGQMCLQENERLHNKETQVKNTQWHLTLRDVQFEGLLRYSRTNQQTKMAFTELSSRSAQSLTSQDPDNRCALD